MATPNDSRSTQMMAGSGLNVVIDEESFSSSAVILIRPLSSAFDRDDARSRLKELGCKPLVEFSVIKYFAMDAAPAYVEIYTCVPVALHSDSFHALHKLVKHLNLTGIKGNVVVASRPVQAKSAQ